MRIGLEHTAKWSHTMYCVRDHDDPHASLLAGSIHGGSMAEAAAGIQYLSKPLSA